ncbi:MAG: hypothetical protein RLZZ32_2033 [Cyanobacteriota bacterium]
MSNSDNGDRYRIDPNKLPKQIEIEIPFDLKESLLNMAEGSGRSIDELILDILDKALQEHYKSQND